MISVIIQASLFCRVMCGDRLSAELNARLEYWTAVLKTAMAARVRPGDAVARLLRHPAGT